MVIFSPSDESLHSYILRVFIIFGEFDFHPVITPKGEWRVDLILNRGNTSFFDGLSKPHFVSLVRESDFRTRKPSYYQSPFQYLAVVDRIFSMKSGDIKLSNVGKPIRYCYKCMISSVEDRGFAYFKAEWNKLDTCKVHSEVLTVFDKKPGEKIVDSLLDVLCCKIKPNTPIKSKEFKKLDCREGSIFDRSMSPCLLKELMIRTRKLCNDFFSTPLAAEKESIYINMNELYKALYLSSGNRKKVNFWNVYEILLRLIRFEFFPVYRIFYYLFDIIDVKYKFNDYESCTESILVYKDRDCKSCGFTQKVCAISPHIEIFVVDDDDYRTPETLNYCEKLMSCGFVIRYGEIKFSADLYYDYKPDAQWNVKYEHLILDLHNIFNVKCYKSWS